MLDYIRSRAQGWVAWVIVGLITVPFALWGIHNYVGGGGADYVAKVDGQEISRTQFENNYLQHRQQLEQMFGGQLPEMFTEQMLRAQVLEQMIDKEVIIQAALSQRMRVSDQELARVIRSVDAFYEDGRFSEELYVNLLRRQGMSPAMFEQRVRRDLLAEQFQSSYINSVFVTPAAIDHYLRLDRQQRTVSWLQINAADFADQVTIDETEIQAWYEANSSRYQTPEQVRVDYLQVRAEDIAGDIAVDEAEIRNRYDARLEFYRSPEERRASHILIRVAEEASDSDVRAARERTEDLLARIRAGEDFATLASSESEDPGSARNGGDLGFFGRGIMVPSFDDVAFALEPGQVSELVRSPFGFHIIRLEEIRGGALKPFADVQDEILREIQQEIAAQRYYELTERLATFTYEQADTLQFAAEELGLEVQTSAQLTRRGGPGIGGHPQVIDAAFSDEVLDRGVNSQPLEIGRDQMIVLRLNEYLPASLRPLEEVREEIVQALHRQRVTELSNEAAAALLEQIRTGTPAAAAAAELGLGWSNELVLQRDSKELEQLVVDAAFSMSRPKDEAPATRQVTLANGDQILLLLHQVEEGDPATASDQQRAQAEQVLQRAELSATADAVLKDVRIRSDVQIRR